MVKKALLIGMYFLFLSQVTDPNGNIWDNECQSAESFDSTGFATAYFNDPDQDCISNEFLIFFNYADGTIDPYGPWDWQQSDPNSGGYYDFNSPFWSCCTGSDTISGGNNNTGGDVEGCPCTWEIESSTNTFIIDCPPNC